MYGAQVVARVMESRLNPGRPLKASLLVNRRA